MNKLLLIFAAIILFSCEKKQKAPKQSTTTQTQTTSTTEVYCFYQTNFGGKAFLFCAKNTQEYNYYSDYCINNNIQAIVERKTNCSYCQ